MASSASPTEQATHPLRTAFAWLVIIVTILVFALGPRFFRRKKLEEQEQGLAAVELAISARYAIGAQQLLRATQPAGQPRQIQSIERTLHRNVHAPVDELRLVPVIAELNGPGPALEKLDEVEPKLDKPELKRDADALRRIYRDGVDSLSVRQREELLERHAFFAKLALSWGKDANDPLRKSVTAAAWRTVIGAMVLGFLVIAALIAGIVLLVLFIVFAALGKIRPLNQPPPSPRPRLLEAFAIYLLAMIATSLLTHYVFHFDSLAGSALFVLLAPLALAWPAARLGVAETAREIGFLPGRGVVREALIGLGGYLTGLPIIAVGFMATILLSRFAEVQPVHPIIEMAGKGPRVTLQLYLLACGVAPMVEETMFRGALYQWFRIRLGWIISSSVVGFLFAAIHPQGWAAFPALASIGFVFAAIREYRNSLLPAMVAHAFNNFVAVTFMVVALG